MTQPTDKPQEKQTVKLHLACGQVYLQDYINIDAVGDLAAENPDLVAQNLTNIRHYYKNPLEKTIPGKKKKGRYVVDILADIRDLHMFPDNSADEILAVNVIDHLRFQDLPIAVAEWRRVLKSSGVIILDVADCVKKAKLIVNAKTTEDLEWALRLMYCHGNDQYDSHHWGYTPAYLDELMTKWGFEQLWSRTDYIKHDNPGFQSAFRIKEQAVVFNTIS